MTDEQRTDLEAQVADMRAALRICKRQLVEANRMTAVGELLAGIIHEINTPIGSILSNNQVAARSHELLKRLLDKAEADREAPAPKSAKILDTLLTLNSVDKIACERIVTVVRSLKTLIGGRETQFQRSNLNEVLDNSLKLAYCCEFRRRIQVESNYGELPQVECDPHQLGQVFLNLLVNAGQAIEGEGTVSVRTRLDGEFAVVSISDDGGGIALEHRSKIFSTGFTTKPSGVGTGLGLGISKEIVVDVHGGAIDFETELGKGTTFHVRVPVSRAVEGVNQ